jgi:putative acetyltransferase
MISIRRTNAQDPDFKNLVSQLDAELAALDGDQAGFYAALNKTGDIDAVVAYIDGKPVSCGAIRPYTKEQIEVKRMFTLKEHRGKGIAADIVRELETWA